jgi:hypothetical protein
MVDAQYPSSYTDSATFWSIIFAEELDSDGGTAGDGQTLNITSLTPDNKFIFLHLPSYKDSKDSKDTVADIPGNYHVATILGMLGKKATIGPAYIIDRSVDEMNNLDEQIEEWMTNGNSRAGKVSLYMALKLQQAGSTRYKTFTVDGTRQNWARVIIKKADTEITPKMFKATFQVQAADN